jgi:hypothetical protein
MSSISSSKAGIYEEFPFVDLPGVSLPGPLLGLFVVRWRRDFDLCGIDIVPEIGRQPVPSI